jgi:hypothetical protein
MAIPPFSCSGFRSLTRPTATARTMRERIIGVATRKCERECGIAGRHAGQDFNQNCSTAAVWWDMLVAKFISRRGGSS